jgi:hypothetical protein
MRPALLAFLAVIDFAAPDGATAAYCHKFSIWHYPFPQRCHVALTVKKPTTLVPVSMTRAAAASVAPIAPKQIETLSPIPTVTPSELLGGEGDEATRGGLLRHAAILKLKASQ